MADAMKLVPVEPGKVYVEVFGLTGTGKSAVMGEIEIALKALGLPVEHGPDFQAEKNATHADWQDALDLYKPTVVLSERNVSRASPPAREEAPAEGAGEREEIARIVDPGAWALQDEILARPDARREGIAQYTAPSLTKADRIRALRNRTSEPEAGPVAWRWRSKQNPDAWYQIDACDVKMHRERGDEVQPIPAPATADKLKVAKEALERAQDRINVTRGPMGSFYRTESSPEAIYEAKIAIAAALAALNEQPQ